nr:MAG TPA: hypothetical protein [Caudoviricetes sp.]
MFLYFCCKQDIKRSKTNKELNLMYFYYKNSI